MYIFRFLLKFTYRRKRRKYRTRRNI